MTEFCAKYDEMASGLDLLIMGTGEKGQIGFNEFAANEISRTRTVMLPYTSRKRQVKNFGGNIEATPDKAQIVKQIVEGPINPACPASLFQKHNNISFYVEDNLTSLLTRNYCLVNLIAKGEKISKYLDI